MSNAFDLALKDVGNWKFDRSRPTRQADWNLAICAAVEELCAIHEARALSDGTLVLTARSDVALVRRGEHHRLHFPPWAGPAPRPDESRPAQRSLVTALDALDEDFSSLIDLPTRFERGRLKEAKGLSGYLKTVFMREDDM